MKFGLVILLFLGLVMPGFNATEAEDRLVGKVVGVSDGDTITVLVDTTQYKIRLAGIDCPEKNQDYGNKAKQFTSALVFGKTVVVIAESKDKYGRIIAYVYAQSPISVNRLILRQGLAWFYAKYSKDKELEFDEAEARKARLGLWSLDNPVPPWQFRKKPKKYVDIP